VQSFGSRAALTIFLLGYNYLVPLVLPSKEVTDCLNGFITPLAVSDPVALYALLALASFHYDTGAGSPSSKALYEAGQSPTLPQQRPDYLVYKQKSISLVNRNMERTVDAISRTTIFATMCLIALEICGMGNVRILPGISATPSLTFFVLQNQLGDTIDIAAHVQGLQKLLALRGGFYDIPIVATEQVYT
jgi:hypothetical protein